MTPETLTISASDLAKEPDDRFQRFSLIEWWDQRKLSAARVLVIGAGALGNEIVKNLALLGVGHVVIVDMDRIEHSNLSRSVLYRAGDEGRLKADVAAEAARDLYPDIKVRAINANVIHDLGMGVFRWADIVLCGLDNREARLAINRACYRVNRPWIDGAIEQIQGTARLFIPDGPCYECTMSERDWKLLQARRSCNLLTRAEMESGRTPTTPTVSSIIAGVQCQEAVKLIHGLPTIGGRGWVFTGLSTDAYQVEYQRKPSCYSHDPLGRIVALNASVHTMTVREALEQARELAGNPSAELELPRDIVERLVCASCGREEQLFTSLGRVKAAQAACPHCTDGRRDVVTFDRIRGNESFLDRTLGEIGVPPMDILIVRTGGWSIGMELSADAEGVLGPLAAEEGLEWT